MTSWTERMHRRAASIGTVVTSCGHLTSSPYPRRIEKVKFGVPVEQVCRNDIPGPLLVLILVLNKEGPFKKDVFRAPGNQANMKKLIHFLQQGRLVNIENFSVHTIASVLKKFLRKIPGGIFGPEGEKRLFEIIEMDDIEQQRDEVQKLILGLHVSAQRLLALLIGTFRMIASRSDSLHCQTLMSSEALGVSVAPSFFHSCVSEGKNARLVDVGRFKMATKIITFLIDNFGVSNLFGRENYEYYARITGRILKVENDWYICFRYPVDTMMCCIGEESQSTPVLADPAVSGIDAVGDGSESLDGDMAKPTASRQGSNLGSFKKGAGGRLCVSLGGNGIYQATRAPASSSSGMAASSKNSEKASASGATSGLATVAASCHHLTGAEQNESAAPVQQTEVALEDLRARNRYAESTRSLSFLPEVHERQTARMRTRSEWFLSPNIATAFDGKGSRSPLYVGSSCIAEEESCYYSLSNLPGQETVNSSKFDKTPSVDGIAASTVALAGSAVVAESSAPFSSLENRQDVRVDDNDAGGAGGSGVPSASDSNWLWSFQNRPPEKGSNPAISAGQSSKDFASTGSLFCLPPLASSTPEKSSSGATADQKIVRRSSSRKEKRGKKEASGSGPQDGACVSSAVDDEGEGALDSIASPKKKQRESSGNGGGGGAPTQSAVGPLVDTHGSVTLPYNPRI